MPVTTDALPSARKLHVVLGLACLWLASAGCGSSDRSDVPLYPAQGKVTLGGKPLQDATLQFIPVGQTPGQGGFGQSTAEGTYEMKTRYGETGLPAGNYKVVVSKAKGAGSTNPANSDKPVPGGAEDEMLSPTYTDPLTTVLKATVAASGDSKNNFDLKPGKRKNEAVKGPPVGVPVPLAK